MPVANSTDRLLERTDSISRQISALESAMCRSTRAMGIVGLLALTLLSGYFYFGYHMIADLLEPSKLVPFGASILESNLPAAREGIVKQVNDSAPAWASHVSVQARGAIPSLRSKLEDYTIERTDELLAQVSTVTEDQIRKAIQNNRPLIENGFKELADSETLSEESLTALVNVLDQQLQLDMKTQAELVLETLRHLRARVKRLQEGASDLDEEERIERRIAMISRRLQLTEADQKPIQMPERPTTVKTDSAVSASTDGTDPKEDSKDSI